MPIAEGSSMKTPNLAFFVWNSWKSKNATSSQFVPLSRKTTSLASPALVAKRIDFEKRKIKKPIEKTTPDRTTAKAVSRDLLSSTQSLDACFSTLMRRCT